MREPIRIPKCLEPQTKELRWLLWRWAKGPNGKLTKPPYDANNPSVYAESDNPQTWASCETAMRAYERGLADGIGFALMNSGIAALDLDDCRDPESGKLALWAQQLVDGCGTYCEITPSGTGCRIIGKAAGARLHRKLSAPDGGSVEVYRGDAERYITISGNTLTPAVEQLGDIDAVCDRVVAEFDKKPPPPPPPQQPGGDDRSLEDLIQNGCGSSFGGDKSRAVWRVINLMLERGDDRDKIARVLVNPANGISTHCLSKPEDPTDYALRQIDKAISKRAGDDAAKGEITRLAKLPSLEYEMERTLAAEELGIRASALDKLVSKKRAKAGLDDLTDKQGKAIEFPTVEPWPEPINGAALLDEVVGQLGRYMIMSDTDKTIAAIWTVHTHIFDKFVVTPRLSIRSPLKGCGKTHLFSVLGHWTSRTVMAASITPSVVFRLIERYRPTLLVDEAGKMFLDESGEARRILNAGYRFDGAVLRNVGDSYEPRMFKVFAPVAFALIGTLPSDLHSRCICVNLKKKLRGEKIEAYRIGKMQHLDALARKIVRWTSDNADAIANANPELPPSVINRDGDLWRVMLSIAKAAGGDWETRVKQAIDAVIPSDDDSEQLEKLLADMKVVFAEKGDEVSSTAMEHELVDMEGRPWAEMGRSRKPLTAAKLARMLQVPGVSVSPRKIKGGAARGYARDQFDDIFARYLPESTLSKCPSVLDPMKTEGTDTSRSVLRGGVKDTSESVLTPMETGVSDTRTLRQGVSGEIALAETLDATGVAELAKWWRKRIKALQKELSPALAEDQAKKGLREILVEMVQESALDAEIGRVVRAANKTKRNKPPVAETESQS
jgi:putative DNA primase/helicase